MFFSNTVVLFCLLRSQVSRSWEPVERLQVQEPLQCILSRMKGREKPSLTGKYYFVDTNRVPMLAASAGGRNQKP